MKESPDMHPDPTPSVLGLRRVERIRVFEHAVEQIRELILHGTYGPGEKLPTELELSNQLNIGRSSIREALRVLEAEGLIEVRRGIGAYVVPRGSLKYAGIDVARWVAERKETLEQLLQVRETIEGLTAALAASSKDNEALTGLKEIVQRQAIVAEGMRRRKEENVSEMADLDVRFHMGIGAMSGNDIAEEIVSHLLPAFAESNRAVLYVAEQAEGLVAEHRLILEAIQNGDSASAEKTMRKHISRVREEIKGLKATSVGHDLQAPRESRGAGSRSSERAGRRTTDHRRGQ